MNHTRTATDKEKKQLKEAQQLKLSTLREAQTLRRYYSVLLFASHHYCSPPVYYFVNTRMQISQRTTQYHQITEDASNVTITRDSNRGVGSPQKET